MHASEGARFANESRWNGCVFNGVWHTAAGGVRDIIEPATGKSLGRTGVANPADIALATQSAAAAQRGWAATPPRERAEVFRRAAAFLQQNAEELTLLIARETGGILPKAEREVQEAIALLHVASALPLASHGEVLPPAPGRLLSIARRVPHGVVGVISPFNFPLILSMRSIAPALATGNAVVHKPDVQTPITGGFIIARAFEEGGLPKGVLHVLPGGPDAGEALVTDPNVQMISFTGSSAAGRRVGELAGKHLKKVSLELGGKNSLIVLDDADLELAASNAAFGAYLHQGQICMASGRILVQEKLAPALTAALVGKAQHLPVGDPATGQVALGPIINERQLQRVHGIVQDSVKAGAKLEAGGTYEKLFYKPTVLSGVKPGMRAFDEEVFGPVANIIAFKTDDEAAALANQTEYGLAAGVISASVGRAMALGEKLNVGLLHINDQTVADECVNPFGGRGCSGNGNAVGGPADIDEYTRWQWVTVKDAPPRYPF
jgi:benzaldehyde dehydrogenase (NAD)